MEAPQDERALARKQRVRRIVGAVISLAVVVLVFAGLLPQLADYGLVVEAVDDIAARDVALLGILTLATMLPYWTAYAGSFPGLSVKHGSYVHLSSTAVSNTVPVGGAAALGVQIAMFASWGFRAPVVAAGMVVLGLADNVYKVGLAALAGGIAAVGGTLPVWVKASLAAGIGVLLALVTAGVVAFRTEEGTRRLGAWVDRLVAKLPFLHGRFDAVFADLLPDFRERVVFVMVRHWGQLFGSLLIAHGATYFLLWQSLRAVGVTAESVDWKTILLAYSIIRLVIAIPITPGGVGVAELGLVTLMAVSADEATAALVTAGVLVFRGLSFLVPIGLGGITWVLWRWEQARARRSRRDHPSGAVSSSPSDTDD